LCRFAQVLLLVQIQYYFRCHETKKVIKESNQRKFKAADNFGALVFQLVHAIQLVVLRPPQTVLLTLAHRRKLQNSRYPFKSGSFAKIAHWAIF
jgi:hypothetical protein